MHGAQWIRLFPVNLDWLFVCSICEKLRKVSLKPFCSAPFFFSEKNHSGMASWVSKDQA